MEMLPSMRMPVPSTSTGKVFESDVTTSDRHRDGKHTSHGISRSHTEHPYVQHDERDDEHIAAFRKRKKAWAEIAKNLHAALKADDQHDANLKDAHDLKDESESPEVEDSPRREGSESPETDVDFRQSSSDGTDFEWVLRTENVCLKASDTVFMVEENGIESVTGAISGDLIAQNEETVIGSKAVTKKEPKKAIPVPMDYAKEISKHQGESEEGEESREKNQRRKNRRNIGLAASATAAAIAAIWVVERLDMA